MRPIELNQRRAAPAGPAAGQAFYTPADPRAALERSPAMELTERARPAQGGNGSLTGPVLQRYQAEQAAAATAYDGAEKPGSGAPAAAGGQAFYTPADPRAALERSPAMELTERARLAQGGTGSLMGPVLQRYQAEQAAAATAYDGAEKPGSGAPAGAGGQAFYTPADPRAALERSPAMELTERARPAQGGTGSLMGPVLQRYQAEQAAATTAYDGAEKPGVLSRIWAGVQDLAGDFADKEEPYWEKFRRGDVAGGLVNFAAVTAGLPQSLYLNGLSALLDLLAGKRPEFHYNMDGMDYLREIEERTGAPGAYTWLTEKQGSENLGDRLVGNLLGLGYNLGTDPASYLTAAGAWRAGQAGTPGTPAYGEYVSSGRAADSLSGAARQDAARAWDEREENRSWETEAEPVDIPEEAGIIKITPEYRAGRELLDSIESVEDFVTEPSKLSHVDPDALYDYLKESGYEVKPLGRGNFRDIPYEDGGGFRIHWDGDRILSYHPAERSHHNGAYFKVSSGKSGVIRIYLDT